MTSELTGQALQIVKTTDNHTFELDEELLSGVLESNEIRDRHVVVISVAGAFRKGKSFLLDFFLRYMHSKVIHSLFTTVQQLIFIILLNLNLLHNNIRNSICLI